MSEFLLFVMWLMPWALVFYTGYMWKKTIDKWEATVDLLKESVELNQRLIDLVSHEEKPEAKK